MNKVLSKGELKEKIHYFVKEIEPLEEEKHEISEKVTLLYADAKSSGIDTKALKQLIKERKMQKEELERQDSLLNLYRNVLEEALSIV